MKILPSLFLGIVTWFALPLPPAYSANCQFATYQDATAHLPCVLLNDRQLSFTLNLVTPQMAKATDNYYYWRLDKLKQSHCTPAPNRCAHFHNGLDLVIPIDMQTGTDEKYRMMLNYIPSEGQDFYWRYQSLQKVDTQDILTLSTTTPNPNGAFDALYTLTGDMVNGFDKVYKDLKLLPGITTPLRQIVPGEERTLRVFHFNDLHNNLRSVHSSRGDTHYFSQMVKIVRQARANAADNEIVLFLSAGDDHIGNPFDELLGYDVNSFRASAAYRAYSAAGVDAAVIGNHELDRGSALLAKAIDTDARFPILSANLYGSQHLTDQHYYPAVIGVAKGLRIGLIGITTSQETLLRTNDDPQFTSGDILASLRNTLSYVEPLADVIIILSHLGYNSEIAGQVRHELPVGDVELSQTVAEMTSKPAMVIGGHMHLKLNSEGLDTLNNAVPILQAGAKGTQLGETTWWLHFASGGIRSAATAHLIPMKRRDDRVGPDDPDYENYEHDDDISLEFEANVMQPLYAMLDEKLKEVIGQAGSGEQLTKSTNINDRYVGESAIANFMNDAIVSQSNEFPVDKQGQHQKVDIAAFNASGVNSGVEPNSAITFNNWYDVMPFADMIVVTPMTGAQIKEMVMSNAQRLVRPEEFNSDTPPDVTGYISRGFLHFSKELRYTIKLNNDATTAVAQNITLNGQPIDTLLDQTFKVAFGDYIALRGGEGWDGKPVRAGLPDGVKTFDIASLSKNDTGLVYRNEIIAYIKKVGRVDASTGAMKDGRITIIP